MKKKMISLCLVVALAATAIIGGTLAYFTDTDKATNTFTTANVKIKLIEQERKENTTEGGGTTTTLEEFTNNKVLYPITGSAQGEKDEFGLPTAGNYVDKIVTVQNLASDAYVRVYYAIPAALDNTTDDSKDVLHVNIGNKFVAAGNKSDGQAVNADWKDNMGDEKLVGTATIDGISYNVYYQTYKKVLTKGEITGSAVIVGMYLDKNVDYVDADGETPAHYTLNGNEIDFNFTNGVKIPVFAVGAQAAGFDDADTAINTAFGANYNPFSSN